jgi:hypothetical protein
VRQVDESVDEFRDQLQTAQQTIDDVSRQLRISN